ncbi:MAG: hypothetical protein JWN14_3899, partial [Chthonomonadales bacterium]|nr:hypothetical protein [Chthonomonadales bacterium]
SAFRSLRLDLSDADCDVARFDACVALGTPEALQEAIEVYSGPLLEGCTEEWVFQERAVRIQAWLRAQEALTRHEIETGNPESAVRRLRQVTAMEPLRESAYRELMRAMAALGDVAAVVETFRDLRQLMHRELNVEPDPETRLLFDTIRAEARSRAATGTGSAAGNLISPRRPEMSEPREAAAFPEEPIPDRWDSRHAAKVRLPRFVSEFIGREREITAMRRSLAASRLVSLTGMGGVGKTRLAVRIAEEEAERFPDGVAFVDFTPLTDPSLVAGATASALGLREHPSRSGADALADLLETRSMLLLLDNCEHVLAACAALASDLLKRCPDLRILATSRQSLRIAGETEWRLPPLEVPPESIPPQESAAEALLRSNESLRLFLDRALRVRPNLTMDLDTLRTAAHICRRLDGIPLALELAAARLQALTMGQLAARLDNRFKLLVTGDVTAPARQQTLRATLEWSHDLLSEDERTLFRRLSLFAGGWSLEAAEAVCVGDADSDFTVLDGLASLVDKSLVLFFDGGEGRYGLLGTVRQYAEERLSPEEAERTRRLHAEHFLAWAEQSAPQLREVERYRQVEALLADYGNLRAALTWCFGEPTSDPQEPWTSEWSVPECASLPQDATRCVLGLRLVAALADYWWERDAVGEGVLWLTRALRQDRARLSAEARARVLCGLGRLLVPLGRLLPDAGQIRAACRAYEEALDLFQQSESTLGSAEALAGIGLSLDCIGESEAAWEALAQSLTLYREHNFLSGMAGVLNTMGCIRLKQERNEEARTLLQQSHATAHAAGYPTHIAELNLGQLAYQAGDHPAACEIFERHLAVARAQGHQIGAAWLLGLLASVYRQLKNYVRAQACIQEDIAIRQSLGLRVNLAQELALLAVIRSDRGDYPQARAHLAEAMAACRAQAQREGHLSSSLPLHPTLEAAAIVAAAEGEKAGAASSLPWATQSARLLGAAEAAQEACGQDPSDEYHTDIARLRLLLRDRLDEATYTASWNEGRSRTPQQTLEAMTLERWF